MGNENKVKDNELVVRKTKEFFKDGLVGGSTGGDMYSLATEYARTKQAKQILMYISVILFIGGLVLTTMLLTMRIKRSTRGISIDIADFKSVNLTELLTTSKRNEGRLRGLQQEVKELKRQRDTEIAALKDSISAQIRLIQTMDLSDADRQERVDGYSRQVATRTAAIRRGYAAKIEPKMKEIDTIKKQMAQSKKNLARTQTAIDNFQQLWDIEEKKLRRNYATRIRRIQNDHRRQMETYKKFHKKYVASLILRYNPIFKDQGVLDILGATQGRPGVTPSPWAALLGSEEVMPRASYDGLLKRIQEDLTLIRRLQRVNYTNSVAPALQRVEALTSLVVYEYDELWKNLVKTVSRKNSLLSRHRNALAFHAARTREHGYVVNADDANAVMVVMNRDYPITSGMRGIVIRGERLKVATIELRKSREGILGRVVSTISNARIQPLDKILVRIQ